MNDVKIIYELSTYISPANPSNPKPFTINPRFNILILLCSFINFPNINDAMVFPTGLAANMNPSICFETPLSSANEGKNGDINDKAKQQTRLLTFNNPNSLFIFISPLKRILIL